MSTEQERKLVEIARRCLVRDERKMKQNQQKLSQIVQSLSGSASTPDKRRLEAAVLRQHFFIHEGALSVVSKKSGQPHTRYFWLFDDALVEGKLVAREEYSLRHVFSAPVAILLPTESSSGGSSASSPGSASCSARKNLIFQVITKERRFTVAARSPEERDAWSHAFRLVIGGSPEMHQPGEGVAAQQEQQQQQGQAAQEQRVPVVVMEAGGGKDCGSQMQLHCTKCGEGLSGARGRHFACTACGKVVCSACSEYRMPQGGDGRPQRVCHFCHHSSPSSSLVANTPSAGATSNSLLLSPRPRTELCVLGSPRSPGAATTDHRSHRDSPRPRRLFPMLQRDRSCSGGGVGEMTEDVQEGLSDSSSPSGSPPSTPSGELVTPEELPVVVQPSLVAFSDHGYAQVPIDVELCESMSLFNRSTLTCHFRFLPQRSRKCSLAFDPIEGVVNPGSTRKIKVRAEVTCTTRLLLDVSLLIWRERAATHPTHRPLPPNFSPLSKQLSSSALPVCPDITYVAGETVLESLRRGIAAKVTISLESQLSAKLDGDELQLESEPVGDGSYGVVYKGDYRGLEVAVKVLKNQTDWATSRLEEFKREVRFLENIRHPCVVAFIGAVHLPGELATVTEFCPLGSLSSCLRKRPGAFTEALRLKCLHDCARGMDFLHRSNILHRDLKPSNLLMISMEPRSPMACKLSDFGTMRDVTEMGAECGYLTRRVGSVMWMAPEVIANSPYEKPADVYSFGVVAYEVLGGLRPYHTSSWVPDELGVSPVHGQGSGNYWKSSDIIKFVVAEQRRLPIPKHVPYELATMIAECWSHDPKSRPGFVALSSKVGSLWQAATAAAENAACDSLPRPL